ncbi:MAG: hypothetical protein JNJ98_07935 [Gemmatimonadetes bacterium]|nr:hypothetical protein [Gemmatimonadota bacterium]
MSSPLPFVLYDDALARRAEPFALTRPFGELRAGALLVRERWAHVLGGTAVGRFGAPHLARFEEFASPPAIGPTARVPAGTVVVNTRCAPRLTALDPRAGRWRCEGIVAAVRVAHDLDAAAFASGDVRLDDLAPQGADVECPGWWMHRPWDLVRHLIDMLGADIPTLGVGLGGAPAHAVTLGSSPVLVDPTATIEPLTVFDASAGPILIQAGASIAAFTRVVGPCVIGPATQVLGGRVAASSIGPSCRVHGELSTSIFVGHANKGHDGFVGHSILGRWANLGAGTTTSNLKNTYGPVHAWSPDGEVDTGMQFLGTLLGDHAKTAIGTRLTTGAIVGAGANVLADGLTPKVIAPFAFGDGTYRLDKFLEVAARVMARRQVALSDDQRSALAAAHAARWPE